jgi:hypothetical protein
MPPSRAMESSDPDSQVPVAQVFQNVLLGVVKSVVDRAGDIGRVLPVEVEVERLDECIDIVERVVVNFGNPASQALVAPPRYRWSNSGQPCMPRDAWRSVRFWHRLRSAIRLTASGISSGPARRLTAILAFWMLNRPYFLNWFNRAR